MSKILLLKISMAAMWGCWTVGGAAFLFWSRQLSLRYNSWTTRFRERHLQINPPPTPEMRELNTKVVTWLFRILGAFLLLLSLLALIALRRST